MSTGYGRAFARAALLGNPSDGYGGRTIALALRNFSAAVEVRPAADAGAAVHPPEAASLVNAAIARFGRCRPAHAHRSYDVRWRSAIPRQVGLAGSSAIVIAALRALADLHGERLEAGELAAEALAAEVEELGIAAGPQDRVVQAHEGLVSMDFGAGGVHEVLDAARLPPLFVAYRTRTGLPSHRVHAGLRERWERGDADVRAAMAELVRLARAGHDAIVAGDAGALGRLIDANFEVRRGILDVDPGDVALVECARAAGASAHLAGSGGAIVGTVGVASRAQLERCLRPLGCAVIAPEVACRA